jgi:hypothetical protein
MGYETEEVIEFCVDFIPDLESIGVPESRHEGRLSGKRTLGKKHISVRGTIISIKSITQFFKTPPWWSHMSRYTRSSYDPSFQGRIKLGLGIITWKLLAVGCEKNVRVMTISMSNCICWQGIHCGTSSRTKGTR